MHSLRRGERMINLIKQKHHSAESHKNNAITEWPIVVDEDKKLAKEYDEWQVTRGRTGARVFRVPLKGQVIEATEKLTLLADFGQAIMRQGKLL